MNQPLWFHTEVDTCNHNDDLKKEFDPTVGQEWQERSQNVGQLLL